ncbi:MULTISPECIES: hypothetical protein [Gammaproteobacteria]|uniref:hypothetical protein n=1 Tax=Gammaproteobacteria TaxID=1236 RepID=UPI0011154D9E|nr:MULTISPECIES: hypothetical protein [Gammaproteobacteria]
MNIKQMAVNSFVAIGLMVVSSATTAAVYGQLVPPPKPIAIDPSGNISDGFNSLDRAKLDQLLAAASRIQRMLRPHFDDGSADFVPPPYRNY